MSRKCKSSLVNDNFTITTLKQRHAHALSFFQIKQDKLFALNKANFNALSRDRDSCICNGYIYIQYIDCIKTL